VCLLKSVSNSRSVRAGGSSSGSSVSGVSGMGVGVGGRGSGVSVGSGAGVLAGGGARVQAATAQALRMSAIVRAKRPNARYRRTGYLPSIGFHSIDGVSERRLTSACSVGYTCCRVIRTKYANEQFIVKYRRYLTRYTLCAMMNAINTQRGSQLLIL